MSRSRTAGAHLPRPDADTGTSSPSGIEAAPGAVLGVTSSSADEALGWMRESVLACPIREVELARLRLTWSPRSQGPDAAHVTALGEVEEADLPPILVHRETRQVIDGTHRVLAAVKRGDLTISARLFAGSERDGFVLAVSLNVRHGLPLSRQDRVSAAERIVVTHPDWSDRLISGVTGLSRTSVGDLRRRLTTSPTARVGRDGRVRPVDPAGRRRLAARIIAARPQASLRAVAREVGLSPATVLDVRRRVRAGLPAVSDRSNRASPSPPPSPPPSPEHRVGAPREQSSMSAEFALAVLKKDPTVRFSQNGRLLLISLARTQQLSSTWPDMVESLPDHCMNVLSGLARSYAELWSAIAAHAETVAVDGA